MRTRTEREPRSILASFGAAFSGLDKEGPMGAAALEIRAKLSPDRQKLIEHVDMHRIDGHDEAVVFRCTQANLVGLKAALKEIGVREQDQGFICRLWWGQGRNQVEIRVAAWQSASFA